MPPLSEQQWIDWPTEKGFYLFYGERYTGEKPEFHLCEAFFCGADKKPAVICRASFMYKSETGPGLFQQIPLPSVPVIGE